MAGREAEFERHLDEFGPRLRALASGILCRPDEADEVCQEAFLTLWRNPPRETGAGAVYTWLRRVVTNLCINRLRRRRPAELDAEPAGDPGPDPAAPDPARQAETTELAAICRGMMGELSADRRAVLSLRVLEDLSYEEIAAALGCSLGTVMSRLHRARQEIIGRLHRLGLSADGVRESASPARPLLRRGGS
jgi:RNA polymerase sigma-70 factor (ECF subfamily)